jgi:hypothetical protein
LLSITIFERLRHFTRTGNYPERIQRALPKRVQEGSIMLSEAVFDYAPDAKLLAAAAKADDWNDHDDEAGQSGIADRTETNQSNRRSSRAGFDSDIEESDNENETDNESVGAIPVIARDTINSPPDGILSSSPQRTKTLNTQITFDSHSPDRRRSLPTNDLNLSASVPGPKQSGQSVLQRLYGSGNANTAESVGTRGTGWDANPPSWVLELNATLRGIEERQRHLEQILGGARSPGTASIAGTEADAEAL